MDKTEQLFLQILKSALQGQSFPESHEISEEQWQEVFQLAQNHKVLPLVFQAVFQSPSLKNATGIRAMVRRIVTVQTAKTCDFLELYEKLRAGGCTPLVVKGFVCRNLYPKPDLRVSSDEDILIPPEQFDRCRQILQAFGMETDLPNSRQETDYEVPYRKKDSALFIEVHKSLFPPESDAYGDWNRFFEDAQQNAVADGEVLTLSPTDHLFYLICHACKHFIHSGFGIRQVCDIVMFANAYGKQVNWSKVYDNCCQIRAEVFAAAIFRIGEKYLTFDPEKAAYPKAFRDISVDETDMLQDLLSAGIYGSANRSRLHSSNVTLNALSSDRQGRRTKSSLRSTLFPTAKSLEYRYPYLEKYPILLPVAWTSRICSYLQERKRTQDNSPKESLKLGSQRVALLRKYRMIR